MYKGNVILPMLTDRVIYKLFSMLPIYRWYAANTSRYCISFRSFSFRNALFIEVVEYTIFHAVIYIIADIAALDIGNCVLFA